MAVGLGGLLGTIGGDISGAAKSVGNAIGTVANAPHALAQDISQGITGNFNLPSNPGASQQGIAHAQQANYGTSIPFGVRAPTGGASGADPYASLLAAQNAQNASQNAWYSKLLAQEQANAPGTAASLNLNQLNSQASAAAGNSVNPLYSQYLNQYLQQEQGNIAAAQQINSQNIGSEQLSLSQTQGKNELQAQQAGQANALQQGNINVQQQNYQLQSGNAENAKLQALHQSIGAGGLGASGLGQQQIYQAENAKNTADAAQLGQFQYQRDTGNLSTQDTFDQLAQSSLYAGQSEQAAEAATNFSLNDYIRQANYNDQQYRESLESSRQEALSAATWNNEAQLIQQAIQQQTGGKGKNFAASEQAYGSLMNPINMPSVPGQGNFQPGYGATV